MAITTKIRGVQIYGKTITSGNIADNTISAGQIVAGTLTNNEISASAAIATTKLADGAKFMRVDQANSMTSDQCALDMAGAAIHNLPMPVLAGDAASKRYVDKVSAGLKDFKDSVKVATTQALSGISAGVTFDTTTQSFKSGTGLASGAALTIDGVSVTYGDRILVKNEVGGNAWRNGIYVVYTLPGLVWTPRTSGTPTAQTASSTISASAGATNSNISTSLSAAAVSGTKPDVTVTVSGTLSADGTTYTGPLNPSADSGIGIASFVVSVSGASGPWMTIASLSAGGRNGVSTNASGGLFSISLGQIDCGSLYVAAKTSATSANAGTSDASASINSWTVSYSTGSADPHYGDAYSDPADALAPPLPSGTGTADYWQLVRAADYNSSNDVSAGSYVFVTSGATANDTGWLMTADDPINFGTTAIVWTQFTAVGSSAQAGDGLSAVGNTINVNAGSGIRIDNDTVAIKLNGSTLLLDATNGISVNAGNTTGLIPISNGTVCTNLNADMLDGNHATAFAASSHTHNPSTDLSSAVPVAKGGTGATDAATAIGNLGGVAKSTVTAAGDLIVGTGSAAVSRLGIGTSGYLLQSNGSAPVWATLSTILNSGNSFGQIAVSNNTLCSGLNADLLDGNHAAAFATASHTHSNYIDINRMLVDNMSSSSVTTSWTLSQVPAVAAKVLLYKNGMLLYQGSNNDYTISSQTVTFNDNVLSGDILQAMYVY